MNMRWVIKTFDLSMPVDDADAESVDWHVRRWRKGLLPRPWERNWRPPHSDMQARAQALMVEYQFHDGIRVVIDGQENIVQTVAHELGHLWMIENWHEVVGKLALRIRMMSPAEQRHNEFCARAVQMNVVRQLCYGGVYEPTLPWMDLLPEEMHDLFTLVNDDKIREVADKVARLLLR